MVEARHASPVEMLCGAMAFILPLTLYLLTAASAPTWLDSGEFLAVGYVLGSAHPPGHPVFVTLVKLFSLLPIGSLAFRGALASAFFGALSCVLLFKLLVLISRRVDRSAPIWLAPIFGLFGALLFGSSPALWAQSTRPEVYALQLALILASLLSAVGFGLGERGVRDGRLLMASGFFFGLSLANHHFLSLLLLPGVIVMLTEDALAKWRRTLQLIGLGAIPGILLGLIPYVHLPLRSSNTAGAVSLGEAPDLSTFIWVVSARAFQKAVTEPPTTPFGERLVEAGLFLLLQLGPIIVVVAIGGLYFLCRQRWGIGLMLVLAITMSWLARSWMGFDARNPDIGGYFLVPVCVLCLGVARAGPLLATIIPARFTVKIGAATIAALYMIVSIVFSITMNWGPLNLSSTRGAELVANEQLRRLPPRSVVITELFGSGFNLWAAQTIEGMRPDVSHFHFPFIGFPSYVRQVHDTHGDLQGILRSALASGQLDERELSALAQRRAVYVEPLLQTPRNIQPFLLPSGLFWEASAEPLGLTDVRLASPDHFAQWDEAIAILGEEVHEEQTSRILLWRIYIDALLFSQRGEREAAKEAVRRGLLLVPETPELESLGLALEEGEGRLDITPFLPREAPTEEITDDETSRPQILDF